MVHEVTSQEDFDSILAEAGDKLVVVDFTAKWCGPCQAIAPEFQRLSEVYSEVVFIKVDVDSCKAVARSQKISAMPTFKFFKRGILFHRFCGASVQAIEQGIQTYSPADAEPNQDADKEESGMFCAIL